MLKKIGKAVSTEKTESQLSIAVLGANTPSYAERYGAFVNLLTERLSSQGVQAHFYGLTATDTSWLAGGQVQQECLLWNQEILADQLELLAASEKWDAVVLVPWSSESTVGMLRGAYRARLVAISVPQYRSWQITKEGEIVGLEESTYTQSPWPVLAEVLGVTRLGTLDSFLKHQLATRQQESKSEFADPSYSSIDKDSIELIASSAQYVLEMVKRKLSIDKIINHFALHNALCLDLALGASSASWLQLAAIGAEADAEVPGAVLNELADRVPLSVALDSRGLFCFSELNRLGGVGAILAHLVAFFKNSPTVSGRSIAEIVKEKSVTKSLDRSGLEISHHKESRASVKIVGGNVALEGAFWRVSGLKDKKWLSGSAQLKVFDGEDLAVEAVLAKKVKKGDVVLVRNMGPRGAVGFPLMWRLPSALAQTKMEDSIMIITDGRGTFSGVTPAIEFVSPESAHGGVVAVLATGDTITWNFDEKLLLARLTETEIRVRMSRWQERIPRGLTPYQARYARSASSGLSGARLE